jgi:hypothetical protein
MITGISATAGSALSADSTAQPSILAAGRGSGPRRQDEPRRTVMGPAGAAGGR